MRLYTLIICFILKVLTCHSQVKLSFDRFIDVPSVKLSDVNRSTNYIITDSSLILLNDFKYAITNFFEDGLINFREFDFPKKITKNLHKRYGATHYYSERILFLKTSNSGLLFNLDIRKNRFIFCKSIPLQNKLPVKMHENKDSWFFYDTYDTPPQSSDIKSSLVVKNKKTLEEIEYKLPFDFIEYTHISPVNYISVSQTKFLAALCNSYTIKLYDFNSKIIDSVVVKDSTIFNGLDPSNTKGLLNNPAISQNPTAFLQQLQSLTTKGDRIWEVRFINENAIYVRFSKPDSSNMGLKFIDHIWVQENSKWKLANIYDLSKVKRTDLISKDNIWLFTDVGTKRIFQNGKIYFLTWTNKPNSLGSKTINDFVNPSLIGTGEFHLSIAVFSIK